MSRDWGAVFDVRDEDDLFEHVHRDAYRGRTYRYLPDERHGVERGTVLVDDRVIRGYPSIPRVLVLDPGVPDFFDGPVAVEEKFNGYNVRVADVPPAAAAESSADGDDDSGATATDDADGDTDVGVSTAETDAFEGGPLAFTRSGHACEYTTHTLRRRCDLDPFFEAYPDHVLCGEVIGPENPYTSFDYPEVDSVAFRVFDVRECETGDPLPVEERREVCERFGLDPVTHFGTYDPDEAVEAVREVVDDLDERGREGVVMVSADGERRLKYTTSAIHCADLAHAFALPFDYGREFVFPRVIREAFQAVEAGDGDAELRERAHELGEAILEPAVETIRAVDRGDPVGEELAARGDPEVVASLLDQFLDQGLQLHVTDDRREDGERVVEFVKVAPATRDKTRYYLEGGTIDE